MAKFKITHSWWVDTELPYDNMSFEQVDDWAWGYFGDDPTNMGLPDDIKVQFLEY